MAVWLISISDSTNERVAKLEEVELICRSMAAKASMSCACTAASSTAEAGLGPDGFWFCGDGAMFGDSADHSWGG